MKKQRGQKMKLYDNKNFIKHIFSDFNKYKFLFFTNVIYFKESTLFLTSLEKKINFHITDKTGAFFNM